MRVIALTGGIATGKTTVARMIAAASIPVLDADGAAHTVLERGRPGHGAVIAEFGTAILDAAGDIDRAALADRVFADPELRSKLEAITHPLVREMLQKQLQKLERDGADVVVVDIPLLFETAIRQDFPESVLIYAPADLQLQRLMQRNGLSRDAAELRLHAQLPIEDKRRLATWEIDNSTTLEATAAQVRDWLQRIRD